jgi:hypothetical protein
MRNDPQQELFSRLLVDLREHFKTDGYEVFDGALPPDKTPYPFVYLGDCQQIDEPTKTHIIGTVTLTIHVWSNNPKNRGTVSKMLLAIKETCRWIDHTENFAWFLRNAEQSIVPDNTTSTPLLHGIIEAEFKFS